MFEYIKREIIRSAFINRKNSIWVINARGSRADVKIYAHTKAALGARCSLCFPTVIALNFSFSLNYSLQMNHVLTHPLSVPIFPFRSTFYFYIYHFSLYTLPRIFAKTPRFICKSRKPKYGRIVTFPSIYFSYSTLLPSKAIQSYDNPNATYTLAC